MESTHDKEIRQLMEVAVTKKMRNKLDPLGMEKGYFIRPSGFEARPVSVSRPVARNTSWYCHKAWSMMRQGRRDKAIEHYEGAVKANPRHIRSHFNRGALVIITIYEDPLCNRTVNPNPNPV